MPLCAYVLGFLIELVRCRCGQAAHRADFSRTSVQHGPHQLRTRACPGVIAHSRLLCLGFPRLPRERLRRGYAPSCSLAGASLLLHLQPSPCKLVARGSEKCSLHGRPNIFQPVEKPGRTPVHHSLGALQCILIAAPPLERSSTSIACTSSTVSAQISFRMHLGHIQDVVVELANPLERSCPASLPARSASRRATPPLRRWRSRRLSC